MAYQVASQAAPISSIASLKIVNFASAAFTSVNDWNLRRKTTIELNRLSNAELADIGLSRGDIKNVAANIRR
jgi:uncharacterized protein YjiS (DUF1127 family)